MSIKSINDSNFDKNKNLYILSNVNFTMFPDGVYEFGVYEIKPEEEMRIDLIMKSIYENNTRGYENSDVILYLNGIDNPLNLKSGELLYFPDDNVIDELRYTNQNEEEQTNTLLNNLSIQDKTTRTDNNRTKFNENGFSLPPVVSRNLKSPVTVKNGKIIAGGL